MTKEKAWELYLWWTSQENYRGMYLIYRDWHGYDVYELCFKFCRRMPWDFIGILINDQHAYWARPEEKKEIFLAIHRERWLSRIRTTYHLCPVCGRYYFQRESRNRICPECGWEADIRMERDPTLISRITWNDLCLRDYKARYQRLCQAIPGYLWRIHGIPNIESPGEKQER